jgi:DNA-directed RNA polymerase subunit K/omega
MELDAAEKLGATGITRYDAVLGVAKYARRLNQERNREKASGEESENPAQKLPKVTTQALRDVLDGKVEFERSRAT